MAKMQKHNNIISFKLNNTQRQLYDQQSDSAQLQEGILMASFVWCWSIPTGVILLSKLKWRLRSRVSNLLPNAVVQVTKPRVFCPSWKIFKVSAITFMRSDGGGFLGMQIVLTTQQRH
ncbi:unnamed protein product [Prunus armeniaca]